MTSCATAVQPVENASSSCDALWRGRLPMWQPARRQGYRFNLDSVLLAAFVSGGPTLEAVELGAGCGVIGLILLAEGKLAHLVAVERQRQLAELLQRNVANYGWQARATVLHGDLRRLVLPKVDRVVFNPPYYAAASSRPAKEPGRDAARRECFGTLADFVERGAACLRPRGELAAIVPYVRRQELRVLLEAARLRVVRERVVQATAERPPRHLLVAASPEAPTDRCQHASVTRLTPLWVHRQGGGYSAEVQALIDGPVAWRGPPPGGAGRSPSGE